LRKLEEPLVVDIGAAGRGVTEYVFARDRAGSGDALTRSQVPPEIGVSDPAIPERDCRRQDAGIEGEEKRAPFGQ
jgi:hypothetical protein